MLRQSWRGLSPYSRSGSQSTANAAKASSFRSISSTGLERANPSGIRMWAVSPVICITSVATSRLLGEFATHLPGKVVQSYTPGAPYFGERFRLTRAK